MGGGRRRSKVPDVEPFELPDGDKPAAATAEAGS